MKPVVSGCCSPAVLFRKFMLGCLLCFCTVFGTVFGSILSASVAWAGDFFNQPTSLSFEQETVVQKATADKFYAVDLVAGHSYSVVVQSQQISGSVAVDIYQPDSNTEVYRSEGYFYNNSYSVIEFTPAVSGRYTLKIRGVAATVRLQILRGFANPGIHDNHRSIYPGLNTARYLKSGAYAFSGRTEYFRFEGRVGDQININLLSLPANGGSARFRLYVPSGDELLTKYDDYLSLNQRAAFNFTAYHNGVYYLRVDRDGAGSFEVGLSGVRADVDDDSDGLANSAEWSRGSAVDKADTNGDGRNDYQQALAGQRGLYPTEWQRADVAGASTLQTAKAVPYFDQPFSVPMDGFDKYVSFELKQGESVALDIRALRGAGSSQAYLYGPGSSPVLIRSLGYLSQASGLSYEFTARLTGTYYLRIGAAFGLADVGIYRGLTSPLRQASLYQQTPLTAAQLQSGRLAHDGRTSYWYFLAKAGDQVSLQVSPLLTASSLTVSLFAPGDSNAFKNLSYLSSQENRSIDFIARQEGVYLMKVTGAAGQLDVILNGVQQAQDTDADGLPDVLEYLRGLDPARPDTNNNGETDAEELAAGRAGLYATEWTAQDVASALNPQVGKLLPYFNQKFSVQFPGQDTYIRLPLVAGQPVAIRVLNHTNVGSVIATVRAPDDNSRVRWSSNLSDNESGVLSVQPATTGIYSLHLSGSAGLVTVLVEQGFSHAERAGAVSAFFGSLNTARYLQNGEYSRGTEDQYFRFEMQAEEQISVALTALMDRGDLTLELWGGIRNAERRLANTYSISDKETQQLVFRAAQTGVYYLKVKGSTGRYLLSVTGLRPDLDNDQDGLSNTAELVSGLDPNRPDTNGNQLGDLLEGLNGLAGLDAVEWQSQSWQSATSRGTALPLPTVNRPLTLHLGLEKRYLKLELQAGEYITVAGRALSTHKDPSVRLYRPDSVNASVGLLYDMYDDEDTVALDYQAALTGTHYLELPAGPGVLQLAVYRGYRNSGVTDEDRSFYGTAGTAQQLVSGQYWVAAPQNVFRFSATAGQKVSFALTPRTNISGFNFKVTTAIDPSRALIDYRDIDDGESKSFSLTAAETGDYLVFVAGAQGSFILQQEGIQAPSYALNTQAAPAGSGIVTCSSNPVGHGAQSECQAQANSGYQFSHWSGDCSGSSCLLSNVRRNKLVQANFARLYRANAVSNNQQGGSIAVNTISGIAGSKLRFKVNAAEGFKVSQNVAGDCPAGQWIDEHTYETGAISADCEVKFLFNPAKTRTGLPWWVLTAAQPAN